MGSIKTLIRLQCVPKILFVVQAAVAELRLHRDEPSDALDAPLRRETDDLHLDAGQLRRLHLLHVNLRTAAASFPEEASGSLRVSFCCYEAHSKTSASR